MKKRIFAVLAIVMTFLSCDVSKELVGAYNMTNCDYNYKSISGMSISGINLSNGISVTDIPKITALLSGASSSIPLDFTLNLDVKNPNQSAALLHGLQYILTIDDVQFTTGQLNQSLNIAAGETQSLPLTIGVDLATLMKGDSKDAVVGIAKNFLGIGSTQSNVKLQIKPTFMIGNTPITSPTYIPVSFNFGG